METTAPRRTALAALAVAVAGVLAGCGASPDTGPSEVGAVVPASDTASVGGRTVAVALPAGRLSVTVSDPTDGVAAADADAGRTVDAAAGTQLVGVRWAVAPAAVSAFSSGADYAATDLAGPARDVTLTVVTSDGNVTVPMPAAGAGSAWLTVAAGATTSAVEVGYDGLTQRADLATGAVDAGRARPLYRPAEPERSGSCSLAHRSLAVCLLDVSFGVPYVTGAGWAPPGSSYAVASLRIGDTFDAPVTRLRLAGRGPVARVAADARVYQVFSVPDDTRGSVLRLTGRAQGTRVVGSVLHPEATT